MISQNDVKGFKTIQHKTELCIVGGGIAGMFAAVTAARNGTKVVLMQDRPVLGGNTSSEIRMCIRGAKGRNNRETGLCEEVCLEDVYRNPNMNFSIWDSVLYGLVAQEKNIDLILNCSCSDAKTEENRIKSIKGWQTTTQQWHVVTAKIFMDCSGDSVLAPLSGAEFRMGREASDEFGEDIAPKVSDNNTMGNSCLIQARYTGKDTKYIPPSWANKYNDDTFPLYRLNEDDPTHWQRQNFWWLELGGIHHTIDDAETLRDELLKVAFGIWDYIKNSGRFDTDGWELDWVGFLPGKRESRRYVGDYIINQNDVRAKGRFDDLIAYGGWPMDDHDPGGMESPKSRPNINHPAPTPFGIPYRVLYSKNIENLMFAGRNISTTHTAFSSVRVMATCGTLGQAAGMAAAIALKKNCTPRGVYQNYIPLLQQMLMDDDCYLPFNIRSVGLRESGAVVTATDGDIAKLLNGHEREYADSDETLDHAFEASIGVAVNVLLQKPTEKGILRIVFDSDINRKTYGENVSDYLKAYPAYTHIAKDMPEMIPPKTITRKFTVRCCINGEWTTYREEVNNYQRLYKLELPEGVTGVEVIFHETWGYDKVRLYSLDVYEQRI